MKTKTLFVVAAGSGGHILPALQCAQQWHNDNPGSTVIFFTGTSELERKIREKHTFITKAIPCHLTKFSSCWKIPLVMMQAIIILIKSMWYSFAYKPEKIISTGGLLAIPVCIAGWCTRRIIDVYNLDAIPGKANRFLFPLATTIFITFAQTQASCKAFGINYAHKCKLVPYPLRFTQTDRDIQPNVVIERINKQLEQRNFVHRFQPTRKTLFILGGSQGSMLLNTLIKGFIEQFPMMNNKLQIIHQTGAFQENTWDNWYAQHAIPALTFSYDEHVQHYYVISDLIICRAGAGTMFEIAFFNKKCIVIPLVAPTTAHQVQNAHAMAEQHPQLFTILEQEIVSKNQTIFYDTLRTLI